MGYFKAWAFSVSNLVTVISLLSLLGAFGAALVHSEASSENQDWKYCHILKQTFLCAKYTYTM